MAIFGLLLERKNGLIFRSTSGHTVDDQLLFRSRQHRLQLSGVQRLRDQQEEAQGVPGVQVPKVPQDGHAERGGPPRSGEGGPAKVQKSPGESIHPNTNTKENNVRRYFAKFLSVISIKISPVCKAAENDPTI